MNHHSMSTEILTKYEYIIAFEQQGKITFVNNQWVLQLQGSEPTQEDIQKCPDPHDFLNTKGAEGWELVSVFLMPISDQTATKMYLRRQVA